MYMYVKSCSMYILYIYIFIIFNSVVEYMNVVCMYVCIYILIYMHIYVVHDIHDIHVVDLLGFFGGVISVCHPSGGL